MLLLKIVLGSCREKGKGIFSILSQNERKKKTQQNEWKKSHRYERTKQLPREKVQNALN